MTGEDAQEAVSVIQETEGEGQGKGERERERESTQRGLDQENGVANGEK